MAAAFFQGTLGQFASYSSFGTIGAGGYGARQQALAQGRIPAAQEPAASNERPDRTTSPTKANLDFSPTTNYAATGDITKAKDFRSEGDHR